MKACAVNCTKVTFTLPDANPYPFEHKIEVFVRFLPSGPLFSGISSTKSAFLCAFCLRNPRVREFRAQNRHFCAVFASDPPVFGSFEHKIEVFVRFLPSEPPFSGVSSTKSRFLYAFAFRNPRFRAFRAQNRGFCALRDKHDSGRRSERQRHCRTREWHIIRLVFILSRIGKEGKIAFAGVIGEGLF